MKIILGCLLAFCFSTDLFSQNDTLVFVKERSWSGGQCCSHGTDCEVSISKKTYKSIKKIHLVLQQFSVELTKADFYYDLTSKQYKTKSFGFTESSIGMQDVPVFSYHDIDASQMKLIFSDTIFAGLYFKKKNKITVSKVKVASEYLAYP